MTDIAPGDFVKCVRVGGAPELTLGAVYRVAGIDMTSEGPSLQLGGLPRVDYFDSVDDVWVIGYDPDMFTPIYRPKAELIQSLLQPLPEVVK